VVNSRARWVSAAVVVHTLWTSAAPALVYRLYAQEWHLSHTVTAGIFAIYPIVVVAVLIGFGSISDYVGRRATMLAGVAASLVGTLMFALAPNVAWLFAARAFMGVGVGLSAGPSSAAIVEYGAAGASKHAAFITNLSQAAGVAVAMMLAGALIEYALWPTRLSFWVLAVYLSGLWISVWLMPRSQRGATQGWRPRLPYVPRAQRRSFVIPVVAMMTAYTQGVLVFSMGGQVAHDLVGSSNTLVNGAVLSVFAVVSAIVSLASGSLFARTSIALGAVASGIGMGLLAFSVSSHNLPIFLCSLATAGGGYGLLFSGATELTGVAAPPLHRGGMFSALYLFAYLSLGSVAIALGAVATAKNLMFALNLGAAMIGALSLGTIFLLASTFRTAANPP
jgi:predicted MFS family arabinose efflux permease